MQLNGKKVRLRDAREEDSQSLVEYQQHPCYREHSVDAPDAAAIITSALIWAQQEPRLNYQLVITSLDQDIAIGCAGISRKGYPAEEAELGVELNPDYWGLGFASDAVDILMNLATSLNLGCVHARTDINNQRAINLLRARGFQPVGQGGVEAWFWRELSS